jgi:hypothetical protein
MKYVNNILMPKLNLALEYLSQNTSVSSVVQ